MESLPLKRSGGPWRRGIYRNKHSVRRGKVNAA
jgi:hypothetical protein